MSKNLDPNILPEKQNISPLKGNEISQEKPRIGQGRAGMKRRRLPPINQAIAESAEPSKKTPEASKIEMKVINQPDCTTPAQSINNSSVEVIIKDIPFHPDPTDRPSRPVRIPTSESPENIDISLNIAFVENSPFQEGVISETYQRPDKSFCQEPQELEGLVNTAKLVQKFLLKQADTDKLLKIIQRKILKYKLLPVAIKKYRQDT